MDDGGKPELDGAEDPAEQARAERRQARRQRMARARAQAEAKADAERAAIEKRETEIARGELINRANEGHEGPNRGQQQGGAVARINPSQLAPKAKQGGLAAPIDHEAYEAARRSRERRMQEIRGELRRRRRLRALGMLLRFALFVLIPTGVVGWYYYEKATDMYVSESAMIFKSGAGQSSGGLLGSLVGGAGAVQDSVALQDYILSRDILQRLDREHGYIAHFQSTAIDELHRLEADANLDDAYKYYKGGLLTAGKVAVSYDVAEGIVRLEVTAATPEAAKRFADAIIAYGEELVNALNERSRNDGIRLADQKVGEALDQLRDAQRRVAEVQEQLKIFSVEAEAGGLQSRMLSLEAEIDAIRGQIQQLEGVTSNPNDSRFAPLRSDLAIKNELLAQLRQRLTGGSPSGGPSMARLSSELELARVDQAATQMLYSSALNSRETAIAAAAEQSLYLETVVRPQVPVEASKPDRLQNTGLVFLILFATYIVGLLTISLIREQAAI